MRKSDAKAALTEMIRRAKACSDLVRHNKKHGSTLSKQWAWEHRLERRAYMDAARILYRAMK